MSVKTFSHMLPSKPTDSCTDALSLYIRAHCLTHFLQRTSTHTPSTSTICPPSQKQNLASTLNTSQSTLNTWPPIPNASSELLLLPWTLRRLLGYRKSLQHTLVCPSAQLRILQRVRFIRCSIGIFGADFPVRLGCSRQGIKLLFRCDSLSVGYCLGLCQHFDLPN